MTEKLPKNSHKNRGEKQFFVMDTLNEDYMASDYMEYLSSNTKTTNLGRIFSVQDLRHMWQHLYQPEQVLGQPVFAKNLRKDLKKEILSTGEVREAINSESNRSSMSDARSRADKYLNVLMADHKESIARTLAFSVQKVLQQMYSAIHVVESDIHRLQRWAKMAQEEKRSLIFLPTHKSHIDYLVLGLLFFHSNISLPFVAAGDNLNIPLFGKFLQGSGAFFIKRPFPDDKIYKKIFSQYMLILLKYGYNLEFFPEGGRSRSGKLLTPKLGMLSIIINALLNNHIDDCYLVPIAINYEKVIETETYIQEMLGNAKQQESVQGLLRAVELLRFNFGQIDIRIAEPFSLKEKISEIVKTRNLDIFCEDFVKRDRARKQLTSTVGYSVLYGINRISVTTPSALVVTVLLTHHGRGIGRAELIRKVSWLRSQIVQRGGQITNFGLGSAEHMVDKVTLLLRNMINRDARLLESVYLPHKRFELSYYRNQVIHLFVPEGTIACSIYASLKNNLKCTKQGLMEDVRYLSQMLKWEFVYKPIQDFNENFESTFQLMLSKNYIDWNLEKDSVTIIDKEMIDFLCFMLWPFIEAYWMVTATLFAMFPKNVLEEKGYLMGVQKFGETLYYQGELSFFESVSNEMTKMAVTRLIEEQIVERLIINEKGTTIFKLTPNYQSEESQLITLVEKIGKFRRQGKYSSGPNFSPRIRELAKLIAPTEKHQSRL